MMALLLTAAIDAHGRAYHGTDLLLTFGSRIYTPECAQDHKSGLRSGVYFTGVVVIIHLTRVSKLMW